MMAESKMIAKIIPNSSHGGHHFSPMIGVRDAADLISLDLFRTTLFSGLPHDTHANSEEIELPNIPGKNRIIPYHSIGHARATDHRRTACDHPRKAQTAKQPLPRKQHLFEHMHVECTYPFDIADSI